uniref:Uncharacterized protein n=1 Tax=Percolomonas cosmopolitus TaxID=63605 RepID=A0A7S1KNJ1_9EUKA|eukprot:CAMPEP_0117436156 /NCGR_PEP_ID=MMETSP0759-20121206/861_1 /TAXON_ID=63605 /ORGANISM="Percolomonas cosmopolitus, Strain WS" /LENGTH=417 /DNA_ID=CAMNT_0005227745 /DNA_START=5 /DNA_END=1258 /DNA_ORIENTATION=+
MSSSSQFPSPKYSITKFHLSSQSEFIESLLSHQFAQYQSHHIEYRTFFSNHSTHCVVAFAGLRDELNLWKDYDEKDQSAPSTKRLRSYCRWYEKKLEPLGEVDRESLEKIRSDESYMWENFHNISSTKVVVKNEYATVLEYFMHKEHDSDLLDWKKKKTSMDLLNEYVPKMSQSLSGAAFHGLIETGWRINGGFSVAPGLAYLVVRGMDLGSPKSLDDLTKEKNSDPVAILKRVSEDHRFDNIFDGVDGFQSKLRILSQNPGLLNDYDIYVDPSSSYEDLQHFCEQLNEQLYILFTKSDARGDFFVLHAITALHAMRIILGHLTNSKHQLELVRNFWRAVVSAFIVLKRPQPLQQDEQVYVPETWDENAERADRLEHIDVHWYKLFYVSLLTEKRAPRLAPLLKEAVDLYYHQAKKT